MKTHLEIEKLKKELQPKTNWGLIISITVSIIVCAVAIKQCSVSVEANSILLNTNNTIEQRVLDLEKRLESIDTSNFCHSCGDN